MPEKMNENELLELNADLMILIRENQERGALDEAVSIQVLLHKNLLRLRQFMDAPNLPMPEAPKDWVPPMPKPKETQASVIDVSSADKEAGPIESTGGEAPANRPEGDQTALRNARVQTGSMGATTQASSSAPQVLRAAEGTQSAAAATRVADQQPTTAIAASAVASFPQEEPRRQRPRLFTRLKKTTPPKPAQSNSNPPAPSCSNQQVPLQPQPPQPPLVPARMTQIETSAAVGTVVSPVGGTTEVITSHGQDPSLASPAIALPPQRQVAPPGQMSAQDPPSPPPPPSLPPPSPPALAESHPPPLTSPSRDEDTRQQQNRAAEDDPVNGTDAGPMEGDYGQDGLEIAEHADRDYIDKWSSGRGENDTQAGGESGREEDADEAYGPRASVVRDVRGWDDGRVIEKGARVPEPRYSSRSSLRREAGRPRENGAPERTADWGPRPGPPRSSRLTKRRRAQTDGLGMLLDVGMLHVQSSPHIHGHVPFEPPDGHRGEYRGRPFAHAPPSPGHAHRAVPDDPPSSWPPANHTQYYDEDELEDYDDFPRCEEEDMDESSPAPLSLPRPLSRACRRPRDAFEDNESTRRPGRQILAQPRAPPDFPPPMRTEARLRRRRI